MKKITRILSGTLLVALMSFGLATKLNARNDVRLEARDVLTEDFTKSVTGKVVRRAGNEEAQNKISAAKAQVSAENEGKRHIRFVVGLDSVRYADAKFDIVAKDGDTVVKTFADQKVTTAYTHIEAAGEVLSASEAFGEGYNYLIAFTINNVPQAAWDYEFEVTSSVKTEEATEWTTTEVAKKVISKIANSDEVVGAKVDITNTIKEDYNFELISDATDLLEGMNNGKLLIGDVDSGRVYSGVHGKLDKEYDLRNAEISFFVKLEENVYKDRITVAILDGEEYQLKLILTAPAPSGCTFEELGNNWYYVEIDVNIAWGLSSYLSNAIYLVIANQDTTAAVKVIIADLKVSLPGTVVEEDKPNTDFTQHDYSDDLVLSYGCKMSDDTNTTIDGVRSKYVVLDATTSKSTGGVAFYPDVNVEGQNLSFYVKLVEGLHYKNRVTIQLRDKDKIVEIEVKVELGKSAPAGVTCEALEDGWYHIVLDCDSVDTKGLEMHMIRVLFVNIEGSTEAAAAWLDQINLTAK